MLAALNTGHEGGCGTVHANSAVDVPARLEALGVAAGLRREAVHAQVAAGLQVVIHLARDRGGVRRVVELDVVDRTDGGLVGVRPGLRIGPDGEVGRGPAAQRLEALLDRGSRS